MTVTAYERLLGYSAHAALVVGGLMSMTRRDAWIGEKARELAAAGIERQARGTGPAYELIDCAMYHRPITRDLWYRLMHEWPMSTYAETLVDELPDSTGATLEVGAGVGNTTRHLAPRATWLVATDLNVKLVARHRDDWAAPVTEVARHDIDQPAPAAWGGRFDTIVATNVLHCSKDPVRAVGNLVLMLAPGGRLIVAEGRPHDQHGRPWWGTWPFGVLDGWWNRGGFIEGWDRLLNHIADVDHGGVHVGDVWGLNR